MRSIFIFIFAFCIVPDIAAAQEQIDRDTVYTILPVTVTAMQATARLSPVTFSNLSRSDIQRQYSVQDVPVLLSELPSIIFYSQNGNGTGYSYINLRGFDQRRLSVMVNGIPQNDPEDHDVYWIDFPDLLGSTENIQVQRGAGSAFYGPPAIGGSVNLIAVPFRPHPSIVLETEMGFQEYGSTNTISLATRKFAATFNSGLVDKQYMFYGRLGKISTDGYRDKSWAEVNSYFFGAERLDKTMTTRFHLYGGPFSDGLVYNGLPIFYNSDLALRRLNYNYFELNGSQDTVTYTSLRRPQETEQFSQPHFELLNEWRLNSSTTLFNTFFYIQGDGYYDYDGSGLDTSALHIGSEYSYPTSSNPSNILIRAFVGNQQWGWLPRIELEHRNGTLILGAEFRIHRSIHWGKISYAEDLPLNFDPDYHVYEYHGMKDILSLYGHELFRLQDNLTLMADLQFVYNRYGLTNEKFNGNDFFVPYYFLNPRLGVNYNIDDQSNVYISLAYTSREPRLANLYGAEFSIYGHKPQFEAEIIDGTARYHFDKPLAKPERLFDFELGGAYRTEQNLLSVNIFWMEFADELIKSGHIDIFGEPVTGNADRTRHIGLELEGHTEFGSGFFIGGNATISQNRLVHYSMIDSAAQGIIFSRNLDGNPIAGSPDIIANLRIAYRQDLWDISASAKYVGGFYTDNTRNELLKNDSYLVFNLDGTFSIAVTNSMRMRLRGEVRNLFNTIYTMSGEGQEFYPAAERNYVLGVSLQL